MHGFERAFYNVVEGDNVITTFSLNVKGETTLLGAVAGLVCSQAAGTTGTLMLYA